MKKLPKKFQGAVVVRGLGMNSDKLDALVLRKALDQFDATKETFLVVDNDALDRDVSDDFGVVIRCFSDQDTAIRYARAMANGNIDQRVLCVCEQTLVVATRNDLPGLTLDEAEKLYKANIELGDW